MHIFFVSQDADFSNLKDNVFDIQNRSVLIAEIVKASALRFSKAATASSVPASPTVSSTVGVTKSLKSVHLPRSTTFPAAPFQSSSPVRRDTKEKCGFCYHLAATSAEPCLLCMLATGSLDDLTNIEQEVCTLAFALCDEHRSEPLPLTDLASIHSYLCSVNGYYVVQYKSENWNHNSK